MGFRFSLSADSKQIPYQSHIDGLRGVAILLVVAFHFNIPPVSGGFIGVDIFFVISGFLITSLLCLETTIFPSLANFYQRRMKRLLPMFLVFTCTTTLAATLLLLPDDFLSYLRSLYFAFIFQANTYFDKQGKDYFAPNAHELPLLHTWSLSIEWQFYLLFPLFFLFARRWLPRNALIAGMALLVVLLVGYSWHQTGNSQQAYFYTSARFFELLIGCFAALLKNDAINSGRRWKANLALASLIAMALVFDSNTPFPGIHAFEVGFLSAIVILWGRGNRLLEYAGLVHIGRISYSAYLWHWPIAAFLAYLQIAVTPTTGSVLLIAVLGVAHLSYRWVETPGRRVRLSLWKMVFCFVILPAIVATLIFKISRMNDGFFERLGKESNYIHRKMQPYLDNEKLSCLHFKGLGTDECSFGDLASSSSAYLIGDSHAGHYRWFTEVMATQAHLRITSLAHGQCLMLPGAATKGLGELHEQQCRNDTQVDYDRIQKTHPKYVLIAQRWAGYPLEEVKKLDVAISTLLSFGAIPVILGPVAEDGRDLKACFYRHIKLRGVYGGECKIDQNNGFLAMQKQEITALFNELGKKYPRAIWIDSQLVQCDHNICAAEIDGVPIYDDTHHINGYGSATLARRYIERFGNPLMASEENRSDPKISQGSR